MINIIRVLYAEDNNQDADLTRMHFEHEAPNFILSIVTTGADCLACMAEQSFDLLLLDNHLPDMDGIDVLGKLRSEGHYLPVVMITGVGDEEVVAKALRAGAADYISKSEENYLTTLPATLLKLINRQHKLTETADGIKHPQHILYVEPNAMDVELSLQHFAANAPHLQLHPVNTSLDALALLSEKHNFSLVLTDLRVPGMNALELIHEAQQRNINLPFVVITGRGDEATAVAILRLGAYDYLVKRKNYLVQLPHSIDNALQRFHLSETANRLNSELTILNASLEATVQHRTLELVKEISVRTQAELSTRQRESQLRAIVDSLTEGLIVADLNGNLLEFNQAALVLHGFTSADEYHFELNRFSQIFELTSLDGALLSQDQWPLAHILRGEKLQNWELNIRHIKAGWQRVYNYGGCLCLDDNDAPLLAIITISDITERKAAEAKIQYLAFYDSLTNLPNRQLLLDRLQQALTSCARLHKGIALLFIDLDHFKDLNDTLGHNVGDNLLLQVSQRLQACVRDCDTVARLGGDEFVVLLVDLSTQQFEAAAHTELIGQKLLAASSQPYQLGSYKYMSTASIGVALHLEHQTAPDELMKQADIAMYQAKKAGRNSMRFFDPLMQLTINARVLLEDELSKAIVNQQLHLHYQIQVDSAGNTVGVEALIRWQHPQHGTISPLQLIPLAEDTGLILPLGYWVLETACAQLKNWQTSALTQQLHIAVNVSAKQIKQANFASRVKEIIQKHEINPQLLKLELTESMLLDKTEETIATMVELKAFGINFSLDDFGTGYSSLQYLKRLPIDELKIDQSFVRDLVTNASDKAIVRTIIVMAQSLNLRVIAEGVETEEQFHLLLKKGCTHFQGYFFGRPKSIEQLNGTLVAP